MKKGGQFFILAAIIISAVIITLATTVNYVKVNQEPQNFYDTTYQIKQESGGVLDYEIYTDLPDNTNLTDFVDRIAKDMRDKDPGVEFIVVYGNNESMVVRNYATTTAETSTGTSSNNLPGGSSTTKNTINIFGFSGGVNTTFDASSNSFIQNYGGDEIGGDVNVSIGEQNYSFPVTEHKQVILIRQKYVEDEVFVDVR